MTRRCPHCGKSLVTPYPGGMMPSVAAVPTVQEQVTLALHMRANPPLSKRQQVQAAPRDNEKLLCRTPTHFVYDGSGGKRTELIEDARRNPARIRSVNV